MEDYFRNYDLASCKSEDLEGCRFSALTVVRALHVKGRVYWLCQCDCGGRVITTASKLKRRRIKNCGCGACSQHLTTAVDLRGKRFGRLQAQNPTKRRDSKGSIIWRCLCDCGNEAEYSADQLMHGRTVSCGCRREEIRSGFGSNSGLTFVEGTCIEVLEKRKSRSDNTSVFQGVSQDKQGRYRAYIGLQNKKYQLGRYNTIEQAVAVRSEAEKILHGGFMLAWSRYQELAASTVGWSEKHPFFFHVEITGNEISVSTPFGSDVHVIEAMRSAS